MALIDKIVSVSISISNGAVPLASFNKLLICAPASGTVTASTPDDVKEYDSLSAVATYWAVTDAAYLAAKAAFDNGATSVFIAVRKATGGTTESAETTLNRALATNGWYAFIITDENGGQSGQATWAGTNKKLYVFLTNSTTNSISGAHAVGLYMTSTTGKYDHAGWIAKCFTLVSGSESWAYKTISGGTPSAIDGDTLDTIKTAHLNVYCTVAGRDITLWGNTCSGEWIDVIRFQDWLEEKIKAEVFSVFAKNAKVPYTDAGIVSIQNAVLAALRQGQINGGIADVDFDEDGNEIAGYSCTVPRAADVPDSDKASRVLHNVKFRARLAGAIVSTEIVGTLAE